MPPRRAMPSGRTARAFFPQVTPSCNWWDLLYSTGMELLVGQALSFIVFFAFPRTPRRGCARTTRRLPVFEFADRRSFPRDIRPDAGDQGGRRAMRRDPSVLRRFLPGGVKDAERDLVTERKREDARPAFPFLSHHFFTSARFISCTRGKPRLY